VDRTVAVDVERIGPGHTRDRRQVSKRKRERRSRDFRGVHEQARGARTASHEDLRPGVGVAVEYGDAAADKMLPTAFIDMCDRKVARAIDKKRVCPGRRRCNRGEEKDRSHWAAISRAGLSSCSVTCDSASAAAPWAQSRSPQAWISIRGAGRPVLSASALISPSVSLA